MREQIVRGAFSTLAGAVFLMTAAEHTLWALEQRKYWKLLLAFFLGCMAVFEGTSLWKRFDKLIAGVD